MALSFFDWHMLNFYPSAKQLYNLNLHPGRLTWKPENEPLEDYSPLLPSGLCGFQVPC